MPASWCSFVQWHKHWAHHNSTGTPHQDPDFHKGMGSAGIPVSHGRQGGCMADAHHYASDRTWSELQLNVPHHRVTELCILQVLGRVPRDGAWKGLRVHSCVFTSTHPCRSVKPMLTNYRPCMCLQACTSAFCPMRPTLPADHDGLCLPLTLPPSLPPLPFPR